MEIGGKNQQKNLIFLNKNLKFIILGVIVVIFAGGYFTVIAQQLAKVKENRVILEVEKLREFDNAGKYFKKLDELSGVIDNFKKENSVQMAKLEQILPNNPQIPELMAQLEALVKSSGFNLDSLSITAQESPTAARRKPVSTDEAESGSAGQGVASGESAERPLPPNVKALKIVLTVSGKDYFSFKELLKTFEQHIRMFDITSLSFGGDTGQGGYSLNMLTYYLDAPTDKK